MDWNKYYKYIRMKVEEKKGNERIFFCPVHVENTPSFFLNKEKGIAHCFGCNVSYNLATLILERRKEIESDDFEGGLTAYEKAFNKLLELAGLEEDSFTIEELKQKIEFINEMKQSKARKKIIQIDDLPITYDLSKDAKKYLFLLILQK